MRKFWYDTFDCQLTVCVKIHFVHFDPHPFFEIRSQAKVKYTLLQFQCPILSSNIK